MGLPEVGVESVAQHIDYASQTTDWPALVPRSDTPASFRNTSQLPPKGGATTEEVLRALQFRNRYPFRRTDSGPQFSYGRGGRQGRQRRKSHVGEGQRTSANIVLGWATVGRQGATVRTACRLRPVCYCYSCYFPSAFSRRYPGSPRHDPSLPPHRLRHRDRGACRACTPPPSHLAAPLRAPA